MPCYQSNAFIHGSNIMKIQYRIPLPPYRRRPPVKANEIRARIYDFCVGDMISWQEVGVVACAVHFGPPRGLPPVFRFRQVPNRDSDTTYIVDEHMRQIWVLMSTSCLIRDDLLPRYYRNHGFYIADISGTLIQPLELVETFHDIMPLTTKLSVTDMHVQIGEAEVAQSLEHLDRLFAGFAVLESMTFDYPRSLTMSQDAPEQWSRQTLVWLQALHKSCPRLLHAYYRKSDAVTTQFFLARSDSEEESYSKLHINTELRRNFKARAKRTASKVV